MEILNEIAYGPCFCLLAKAKNVTNEIGYICSNQCDQIGRFIGIRQLFKACGNN